MSTLMKLTTPATIRHLGQAIRAALSCMCLTESQAGTRFASFLGCCLLGAH